MLPLTISASSLTTADSCLARYKAENLMFTPTASDKAAANTGTACHGALEDYVRDVYMEKSYEPSWELLRSYYVDSFKDAFDTAEAGGPEFEDGLEMLQRWFLRNDLSDVEVLSVEAKYRYPLPVSIGTLPLTYICDRIDLIVEPSGRRILRVVDYKSIRAYLTHDEVRGKLQARIYDLMMRIQYRDLQIDEFQVVFDLLRHEPVGVAFSREEAEATWEAVIARAERILATPDDNPPETLNEDCAWCVRKTTCSTLMKNIKGGGLFTIGSIEQAVELREQAAGQAKGLKTFLEELDGYIKAYAKQADVTSFRTDSGKKVTMVPYRTRVVDAPLAAGILGPDLMSRYGKLNVTDVDAIIKNKVLDEKKTKELAQTIGTRVTSTSIKITKR